MGFQRAFQNTMTPTVKAFDRHVHFHMIPHHNVRQTHTLMASYFFLHMQCLQTQRSVRFLPMKVRRLWRWEVTPHRFGCGSTKSNQPQNWGQSQIIPQKVVGRQWRTGWRMEREWCDMEKGGGSPTTQKGHKLWEPRRAAETGKRRGVINWCGC